MANGPNDTTLPPRQDQGSGSRTPPVHHRIEVKNADKVQEKLLGGFNWLEDNSKIVVAFLVIAILGGLAYAGAQMVSNRQEKSAQVDYYKAEAPFTKKKEAFEKNKFKAFMPANADIKTPPEVASGDLAKDYGPLLTNLEAVARDHAGTAAGGQAALLAGQTYLEYKQPLKAVEYAQLAGSKLPKESTLGVLGKVLWGNALSAQGDCQGALGVWQQVLDTKSAAYLHPDVRVRSGVCFEKMGQNDRALEMYRSASAVSESASAGTAKGLMRSLELKTGSTTATAPAATKVN